MSAVITELRANCARIVELRDKLRHNEAAMDMAEGERLRAQICIWSLESERAEIQRQLTRLEDEV